MRTIERPEPLTRLEFAMLILATLSHKGRGEGASSLKFPIQFSNNQGNFRYDCAIPRQDLPEVCKNVGASENRGRRECRAHDAPQPRGRKKKGTRAKSPRSHRNNPAFPAQWFYGVLRALPGDQACLTPSPALPIADLTPASGRQNDTTWPYASASFVRLAFAHLTLPRPPHPAPR